MKAPPLLPELVLARVMRVGRLHGNCVLYVAGFFALVSAAAGDYLGTITGLLVAAAGAIEHHGSALLGDGNPRGISWLVSSQPVLFVAITGYCVIRLRNVELPPVPGEVRSMLELSAQQMGMTLTNYLQFIYRLTFRLIIGLSILYQGGLGYYYFSKRHQILRALAEE
jgi:hypothetical protein